MNSPINMLGVIQARMSSRRFPGKVLQPLQGIPMLGFLIQRIQQSACLDKLIVATSTNFADNAIVEYVGTLGIEFVRGAEEDVLRRYLDAIEVFPARAVVRITADNPLTDPDLLDIVVQHFFETQLDYAYMNTVPLGTASDVFRATTLRWISEHASNARHREHINAYILDYPDQFHWQWCESIPEDYRRPDLSFTVDTPAEFKWIQRVLAEIGMTKEFRLRDVIMAADALQRS